MLIGYDGRFITGQPTGNGVYATRLLEALSALDTQHRYRVYMPGSNGTLRATVGRNVDVRVLHRWHGNCLYRALVSFPWELHRRPVDVFHAHYTVPLSVRRARIVLTLHDFFWLVYPEQFVSWKRTPVTYSIRRSISRADCILVGTNFIKQETRDRFGVPSERFAVIPYGIDPMFFTPVAPETLADVRARYKLDAPYVLALGDLHPRKNLPRLLDAFARLPQRDEIKLVLVGKPLWRTSALLERINQRGLRNRVVTTGYVPQEHIPALYRAAEVFCYPSVYEGFGFPILEAMASGTPVAASATTSCGEVAGEAALKFDPEDVDAIAASLARLLEDGALRTSCIAAGRAHARRFTWNTTARRTLAVYDALD